MRHCSMLTLVSDCGINAREVHHLLDTPHRPRACACRVFVKKILAIGHLRFMKTATKRNVYINCGLTMSDICVVPSCLDIIHALPRAVICAHGAAYQDIRLLCINQIPGNFRLSALLESKGSPFLLFTAMFKANPRMILELGNSLTTTMTRGGEKVSLTVRAIALRLSVLYAARLPPIAPTRLRVAISCCFRICLKTRHSRLTFAHRREVHIHVVWLCRFHIDKCFCLRNIAWTMDQISVPYYWSVSIEFLSFALTTGRSSKRTCGKPLLCAPSRSAT